MIINRGDDDERTRRIPQEVASMNVEVVVAVISAVVALVSTGLSLYGQSRIAPLEHQFEQQRQTLASELEVWTEIRHYVLPELWQAHRAVTKGMTTVILQTQELGSQGALPDLQSTIDEYRQTLHGHLDLISMSPEAVDLAQQFLNTAHRIQSGHQPVNDAHELKAIRRAVYEYMADLFALTRMLADLSPRP
jgi:hypothetical protein